MLEQDGSQPLSNIRQEIFCQKYIQGMSATEAYRQAGYVAKNADANAARAMGYDGVKARINYIQAEKAIKQGITQEGQARKLEAVQLKCFANGEHSTYVKACEVQNRLYGLDKQVIEQTEAQRRLSETQAAEARRIAEIRVREVAGLESPEAEKSRQNGTEEPEYALDWTDDRDTSKEAERVSSQGPEPTGQEQDAEQTTEG